MTKKRILLLTTVILLLVTLPAALMADHCFRCRPVAQTCTTVNSTAFGGWSDCWEDWDGCHVGGEQCAPHTASLKTPLATEYSVASVERIDEPRTVASETLVAAAAPAQPSTR